MTKDVEYAIWMCEYWAKKCFARNEDSETGWMYLFMAESLRQGE